MEKKKVFIADSLAREGIEAFAAFPELELVVKTGLPADRLVSELGDSAGLVVRSATQATRDLIAAGRSLKVIGRAGAGVDNIDVKAASERGIVVLNTPGANAEGAGELAVAMMFALARDLARADATMKAGTWDKKSFSGCELAAGHGRMAAQREERRACLACDACELVELFLLVSLRPAWTARQEAVQLAAHRHWKDHHARNR
jgi:phosphoglycerate dehydrogenase-like enzyme